MNNYARGTIVPVGTKIVRTSTSDILFQGQVYTVTEIKGDDVYVAEGSGRHSIHYFAPAETDGVPNNPYI